ncbi:GNAT family N-acetyltransferase [Pseudoalteromonas viridis]|uniref:GNAT family N-acetyltransferase n=1 Tax=Pseudoalteromonas viridis TaxID=339617 RepID=A0ABX7V017_9GAMM|nr:GNAT family N-acetyltransferase [Pseudoalteromonas viridis]QTL34223.1 GNAT family N-acetyltransferase [Pseudoalteromonas viridis]
MSCISNYRILPAQLDTQWDQFVKQSKTSTPFSLSSFILPLNTHYQAYYCTKGDERVAGLLLLLDSAGKRVTGHDLVVHDGVFFKDFKSLNKAQTYSEQFKALQCIAEFLASEFSETVLTLPPSIQDIRPFLWVNYHEPLPMFSESVRYTSFIDIAEFRLERSLEACELYSQASVSRRQQIRYGLKKGIKVEPSQSIDLFLSLYESTFIRQGVALRETLIPEMRALLTSLNEQGDIRIFEAKNVQGQTGSIAIFLLLNDSAYYLFGANDYDLRHQHMGTMVLWEAFYRLAAEGINKVDLEGVNSPDRGWFKLSFGGTLNPYYSLHFESK